MIITTTPGIEGRKITKYLGVVAGEAIIGVNVFKDVFASVRDIVGGRAAAYEQELEKARGMALGDISEKARELGAEAIVGVDIDYEVIGSSMLMVSVSGTAVVI